MDAARTALLIVHLQHDIVAAESPFGALFNPEYVARNVADQVNRAAAVLRNRGGLVVPLRIAFAPDYSDLIPSIPLLAMAQQAEALREQTPGAELVPELTVGENDVVVTHKRPGPFTGSSLPGLLQERGIEDVVVCGVATNASVEGAVRQASDLGYRTVVLSDATSAGDAAGHEASLASQGLFARVLTVAEFTGEFA